ncbi:MAG TPA: type VII secretion integral membrane protein EccD [Mycobacterium sp.]|nr:type VII secretion integral membrane protein EccD [Mycobacterium sp.]
MTGVSELRTVQVMPAAPDQVRVSVVSERTQLDVALPADLPVAAFLPELAELIRTRDALRDGDLAGAGDRDERRTFWVLSRLDEGAAVLAPDETLRSAGVSNGELLRISARRALSPPQLHDDVVDAAARLNRAAFAAWSPAAAKVMAFVGLWLGALAWVIFLMADALSAHRTVAVIGAAVTTVALIAGATVVHRILGLTDIATAAGWPAIAISTALTWVLTAPYGAAGLAVGCAILLALTGIYYWMIGTGHCAYIAAAVVFVSGGLAFLGHALGGRTDVVAAAATSVAALGCLATRAVTARLARFRDVAAKRSGSVENPSILEEGTASPEAAMPTAEQVRARVRALQLTRAGVLAGLAVVVVVGVAVVLGIRKDFSAFAFGLVCAAVLARRSRRGPTWFERAALAVPAVVLTTTACVQAQFGAAPLRLAGVAVLATVAVLAVVAGLATRRGRWMATVSAALDYVAAAALLPLALWPVGVYDHLGL